MACDKYIFRFIHRYRFVHRNSFSADSRETSWDRRVTKVHEESALICEEPLLRRGVWGPSVTLGAPLRVHCWPFLRRRL